MVGRTSRLLLQGLCCSSSGPTTRLLPSMATVYKNRGTVPELGFTRLQVFFFSRGLFYRPQYWVEVKYVTPSPDEERSPQYLERLDPEVALLSIPQCVTGSTQCPLETFLKVSKSDLDVACIAKAMQAEVESWGPTPQQKTVSGSDFDCFSFWGRRALSS